MRRYEAKVRLVVRRQLPRLLRSRFDSQDFVQSIWGSFIRRIKAGPTELEGTNNLIGFLARTAHNKVIDEYRRASSARQDMRREESMDTGAEPREVADDADSPIEVALASETLTRLRELVPEDRRTVLDLKAEGLSTVEIAARLGLGERTVRRVMADLRRRAGMDEAEEAR